MGKNSNRLSVSWLVALFGIAIGLMAGSAAQAQDTGSVAGAVVSSWDGAPLNGATVTIRGTTLATQTDSTGRFQINGVPPGEQVLRFSKSSYASAVVTDVRVIPGQTTSVNGNLRPEFYDMEEYEVTAEEFTQQTEQIIFDRQQSGAMMDAIGSEQFTKLGAGDAGAIVARVTGVSLVGGKYAVVRGLSDRYSRTLMNGLEVPSADPYRLSPQLDLFPSAMIDRIAVSKTFTPDQPGGTGGGTIDIFTKSFPDKPFFKVALGTSYNPNANLIDHFLADPQANMDMIGLPNAPRDLNPSFFGFQDANLPNPPGNAVSTETIARARARRLQADSLQSFMQGLGTANFAGVDRDSPLNSSMAASGGATTPLFGRSLGVFAGANYKRDFKYFEDSQLGRYSPSLAPDKLGTGRRGNINTDYGANLNLTYALVEGSQVGFNFMYAHSTDEEARHDDYHFVEGRDESLQKWQLHYTDREVFNYQLHGSHELPFLLDSKFEWAVGLANTLQNEPDHRFMNYFQIPNGPAFFGDAGGPYPQFPSRFFRNIQEDGLTYRFDWSLPLDFMPEESKFKIGYSSTFNERDYKEEFFTYVGSDGFNPAAPNSYLNDPVYLQYQAFALGGIRTNFNFIRFIDGAFPHDYNASLDVHATYAMVDLGVLSWLRLIGGARVESTLLDLESTFDGESHIKQTDVLPAVAAVVTMITNVNLRLSYGETVARPSFRELADILSYLGDVDQVARGNPNLEMVAIKSYDARLEWFPSPGDVISGGVFYKQLTRPIELYSTDLGAGQVSWKNRPDAELLGMELEARKSMEFLLPEFKGLSLGANLTLMNSSTELTREEILAKRITDPNAETSRPLYEQSPYLANFDLSYDHPTSGTSFTISANITGPRVVLAMPQGPDVYEHSPISLDAAISQKIGKYWTVRFGVKNILDEPFRKTYGDSFDDPVYESFRRGRTYAISMTAEF